MSQTFVNYFVSDDALRTQVKRGLEEDGFRVTITQYLAGPALAVRVRKDSGDAARVEQLVLQSAPEATKGPGSAPTVHLEGYRDGL